MNLLETLMLKARKSELAHFYILESSLHEEESLKELVKFSHTFIRDYYQQVEGHKQSLTHLMDHPDVFVLGNLPESEDPETSAFTVAQAEELSRFFEFKPVQGKRKFAVITEAHRMNTILANKWLKLFEEPQGISTIFLLNPRRQKLLDTIHSRALHLRLPVIMTPPSTVEWIEFLKQVETLGLSQFLETFVRSDKDVAFWTNELVRWEAGQENHLTAKSALFEWLKKLKEMDVFHQPSATKWTLFYSFLREHVLPRLKH